MTKKQLQLTQELADVLHTNFCYLNHTDGCGYDYETDWHKESPSKIHPDRTLWGESAHSYWLGIAKNVIIDMKMKSSDSKIRYNIQQLQKAQATLNNIAKYVYRHK